MTTELASPSIAILVANGFDENHMTAVQRLMIREKLGFKILAPEQGLANGWQGDAWGHYFTVDEQISSAMGSDYDFLIVIGGERGVEKLKTNLHTRRIVNHFLEAEKPVAAIGAGVALLTLSPKSAGKEVSAPAALAADLTAAQMAHRDAPQTTDGALLTSDATDLESWAEALLTLLPLCHTADEAEAA